MFLTSVRAPTLKLSGKSHFCRIGKRFEISMSFLVLLPTWTIFRFQVGARKLSAGTGNYRRYETLVEYLRSVTKIIISYMLNPILGSEIPVLASRGRGKGV